MDVQVGDYKKVINFSKDKVDSGSDSNVVAFEKMALPTLKSHLKMAEKY